MENKWAIAFYGWLLYNAIIFFTNKEYFDLKYQKMDYRGFAGSHWDNWVMTALLAPAIVLYGPEIHSWVFTYLNYALGGAITINLPWNSAFYLGCGPLAEFLYWLLIKKMKKIKPKI